LKSKHYVPHKIIKVVLQLKHLQCLISDHRRDVEINYNITTKYTVRQINVTIQKIVVTNHIFYEKKRIEKKKKKKVAL